MAGSPVRGRSLIMALKSGQYIYAVLVREGTSDNTLSIVLQALLLDLGFDDMDLIAYDLKGPVDEVMYRVLHDYPDCSIVFVHRDSDNVNPELRRNEVRESPANLELIGSNQEVIPVVPVTETESWILYALAGEEFRHKVGYGGVSEVPTRKESLNIRDAKAKLRQLFGIRLAGFGKRRRSGVNEENFSKERRRLLEALNEVRFLDGCESFEYVRNDVRSRIIS